MTEESKGAFASRQQLLGLSGQRRYEEVDTPIGKVRLRSLVATETFEIDNYAFGSDGKYVRERERYARAKRVIETVVDENGNKMFTEMDMEAVANWPEPLMNILSEKVAAMARPGSLGDFAKNA